MQATRGTPVGTQSSGGYSARRTTTLVVTAAAVLAADIVSKISIVAAVRPGQRVHVIDNVLVFTETRNGGAAFSIGPGATVLFTLVAAAVVVVIARAATRLRSRGWAITLGLLLGGALGNLTDRLVRAPGPLRGHVVDWIELPHWPVFNLADSAIVIGGCLAVLLASRGITIEGEPPAERAEPASTEPGSTR